jgi:hypothetical protein
MWTGWKALSYGGLPSSRRPRCDSLIRSPFVDGLPSLIRGLLSAVCGQYSPIR